MGKNKSSGLDGIPTEFCLALWETIGPLVINSFNESFDNQELSDSQKCVVLTLTFKKGDRAFLKKYHPISFTNTVYRILTFTLSLRLQKVIGTIVGFEQTGYIRSRFIGTNARLLEDVIEHCDIYHMEGLMVFLDFEKGFDTVEWPFYV